MALIDCARANAAVNARARWSACVVTWCAFALGACYESRALQTPSVSRPRMAGDAAEAYVIELTGDGAHSLAGLTVALAADSTGDGRADLWVGAPGTDDGCGRVFLLGGPFDRERELGSAELTLDCDAPGGRAGETLAVGDVDDDGITDVLVGAPRADRAAGAAYLVHGRRNRRGLRGLDAADARFVGAYENDNLGQGLAIATGDARALLVGVPHTEPASAGGAFLWSGSASGTLDATSSSASVRSMTPGAHAGSSLSAGCDVNGDGAVDVLVGAWGDDAGVTGGSAHLVLGPIEGALRIEDAYASFVSDEAGAAAGTRVLLADVDADGSCDALVGAPGERDGAGAVYGFLAPSAGAHALVDADFRIAGTDAGDGVGFAIAVGDQDGDGVADVWIGAPGRDDAGSERGALYLVHGPPRGAIALENDNRVMTGRRDGDHLGVAVAAGADLDGDDAHDIAVGAWGVDGADGERDDEGAAYVIRNLAPNER